VTVPGRDGWPAAVAPLAVRRRLAVLEVVAIGHPNLDRCPVAYRNADDAVALADAVAERLRVHQDPWRLALHQLADGCPFAARLVRRLPASRTLPGGLRPVVSLTGARDPRSVLSRNLRQAESKARNRIARAGFEVVERWLEGRELTPAQVAEVVEVHRARDLQLRGQSLLERPEELAFYRALLRNHAELLQMLELRLGNELAAYVLWIRNGRTRVVLDNRVAPAWTQFSAGLIANNGALRAAAADHSIDVLDWGAGVQRYKLQSANRVIPSEHLYGWSSRGVRGALAAGRASLQAADRGLKLLLGGRKESPARGRID
jgi:hypothetical protein